MFDYRLSFPTSAVNRIRPAVWSVPAISDCPVVDTLVGAPEDTF